MRTDESIAAGSLSSTATDLVETLLVIITAIGVGVSQSRLALRQARAMPPSKPSPPKGSISKCCGHCRFQSYEPHSPYNARSLGTIIRLRQHRSLANWTTAAVIWSPGSVSGAFRGRGAH